MISRFLSFLIFIVLNFRNSRPTMHHLRFAYYDFEGFADNPRFSRYFERLDIVFVEDIETDQNCLISSANLRVNS